MSIRILVDINLSPEWIPKFKREGLDAIHWSSVGDPKTDDASIMRWAQSSGYIVFTHDLDFGTTLALTHAGGPSVIQIRGTQVLPEQIGDALVNAIRRFEDELRAGALVVIEPSKTRVRVLPL